jgi:hypothetical protein
LVKTLNLDLEVGSDYKSKCDDSEENSEDLYEVLEKQDLSLKIKSKDEPAENCYDFSMSDARINI